MGYFTTSGLNHGIEAEVLKVSPAMGAKAGFGMVQLSGAFHFIFIIISSSRPYFAVVTRTVFSVHSAEIQISRL